MIDYQKLKVAHELAIEYGKKINKCIDVSVTLNRASTDYPFAYSLEITGGYYYRHFSLDALIAELQKHVKPEPKYKINDEVWHLSEEDQLESFIVKAIDFDERESEYLYSHSEQTVTAWLESQLFPTREALIEHQIEYWTCLRDNSVTEKHDDNIVTKCIHESDGLMYPSDPLQFRCKKCKKYY